jgi:hypothetical protein
MHVGLLHLSPLSFSAEHRREQMRPCVLMSSLPSRLYLPPLRGDDLR